MSRFYEMTIEVIGVRPTNEVPVVMAVQKEWAVGRYLREPSPDSDLVNLTLVGKSSLTSEETEGDFSKRVARAIWKTTGAYCSVNVRAVYLGEPPSVLHELRESDYKRLMAG